MAEAIPREARSDAETHAQRLYYWEFLLKHWLVPDTSVAAESTFPLPARRVASPSRRALTNFGWLKELENTLEQ